VEIKQDGSSLCFRNVTNGDLCQIRSCSVALTRAVTECRFGSLSDDVKLVVGECAANSIKAGDSNFSLTVTLLKEESFSIRLYSESQKRCQKIIRELLLSGNSDVEDAGQDCRHLKESNRGLEIVRAVCNNVTIDDQGVIICTMSIPVVKTALAV
jgi:hypothetical protein